MGELNPRTTHYEFRGPLGAAAISLGLPLLIEMLYFSCNKNGCPAGWHVFISQFGKTSLFSASAFGVYLLWIGTLAALDVVIPGRIVPGTTLRTGKHLMYKFNGTVIVGLLFALLSYRAALTKGQLPELAYIYDHLIELANASLVVAAILSVWVYIASYKPGKLLALGGNTGNVIYDWFIGRELNPRWGPLDLKLFLEMRPGLLLWVLIDLAMAHHQYWTYGTVSNSMILVAGLQIYYVVEGTFYESGLVSMIDTTTDGLGFMLIFGDLSLVPFTYTLQVRYLADNPVHLSKLALVLILSVYITGIMIFRLSNNEKNAFKSGDKSTSKLKYISTPTGSKLLVTGWWGMARHINYTGDWVASLAYCLPCGIIPYYYMIYFAALLIHREQRDEAKCAEKYGETWDEYKRRVPYRFIPYLY